MSQYPPASDRQYAAMIDYRDYTVALYRAPANSPAFEVNGLPIFDLYFILDEMGENLLPIDIPLASAFQAFAAIDAYLRWDTPQWKHENPGKSLWELVRENTAAGSKFAEVMDFTREIRSRVAAFSVDEDFGDDPEEWRNNMLAFMDEQFAAWGKK